jgi:hypothetical protein
LVHDPAKGILRWCHRVCADCDRGGTVALSESKSQYLCVLPFWAAVLPLVTFNASYLIAAALGHVPSCFTYFEGCTSVSSTGRQLPEALLFKTGMVSLAVILLLLWYRTAAFLDARVLRIFASVMVIGLLLYAITLGMQDETMQFLRRVGINGFAFGTLLTQVSFIILYRPRQTDVTRALFRWLVFLCIALPLVGVVSEISKALGAPRRPTNNIAAWNAFLISSGYYFVLARIWLHHGIAHRMAAGRPASPSE